MELARIEEIQAELPASTLTYWREQVQVHIDALNAWVQMSEGKIDAAIKSAKAAADLEDSVDQHPVTPVEVLPARELLADLLLEAGKSTNALVEYEAVLKNSLNRLNALVGAVEAAENSGQTQLAASFRQTIRAQVNNASGPRAARLRAY